MSNTRTDVVVVVGNRPEIIKMSELIKPLARRYHSMFLYTGQHYSSNMRDVFLRELGIEFDHDLACGTSDVTILSKSITSFLKKKQPRYVIVYGDTASTVAGALAAKKLGSRLIHIEAGLRNFNRTFIEERNRVFVDSVSDYFLAPTELHKLFLSYEGIQDEVYVTGNLIVDICRKYANEVEMRQEIGLPEKFILLTLHKPASVDQRESLALLAKFLHKIRYDILFPVHPRTKKSIRRYGIKFPHNVKLIDAVGYREFLSLLKRCMLVMTDSGGVQEEAVILKRPCITLFCTTDRQETIMVNANRLYFPLTQDQPISDAIDEMMSVNITRNPYGEAVTKRAMEAIHKIIG